jgi:hypothetical protein
MLIEPTAKIRIFDGFDYGSVSARINGLPFCIIFANHIDVEHKDWNGQNNGKFQDNFKLVFRTIVIYYKIQNHILTKNILASSKILGTWNELVDL